MLVYQLMSVRMPVSLATCCRRQRVALLVLCLLNLKVVTAVQAAMSYVLLYWVQVMD
jgi:hypothetical protein